MKNIKYLSLFKLFKDNIVQESMISLDNSFELSALYKKIGWRLVRTIFTSKVKTQSRMRTMYNFFSFLMSLRRKHGSVYVVKYLKTSQLAIQKCIAGEKISSLRELESSYSFPRVSNSGLPLIIPLSDRRAIKNKSTTIIRFWLTLFSLYRIVNIPGDTKLGTITEPYTGSVSSLGRVSESLEALATKLSYRFPKKLARKDMGLSFIETSSPSSVISWTNMFHAPLQLARAGLGQVCLDYMNEMGYSTLLRYWVIIFKHAKIVHQLPHKYLNGPCSDFVGKLSTKKEPAGKIRVFAMVDVWTQSLLKPLHLALFSFLKSLPNDGTFDQNASWKRCADKAKASNCSFGYDLSAATDRLPIQLQVSILKAWIGPTAAKLWQQLLTDRTYFLKTDDPSFPGYEGLRYTVGQPMGALSSWAMLAVTHHLLVQLAYLQSDLVKPLHWKWYDNYEIIGDDINIFDKSVAEQYLTIMESIGVPINLSKSVVAVNPTTEFAKVTTHFGENVSALSWKMFISQNTMMGRVSILWSLIHKNYLPSHHLGTWLIDVCAKARYDKGVYNYVYFPILAMFAQSGKISYEHLLRSLYSVQTLTDSNTKKSLIKGVNSDYLRNLVISLIQGKELRLMSLPDTWNKELAIFKGVMVKSIKAPNCDPSRFSRELAEKIFIDLFPYFNEIKIWDTKLKVQWSEMLSMQTDFTFLLKEILFEKLTALDIDVPMNYLKLSVEEILDLKDKAERARELLSLVDRAKIKLAGDSKPVPKRTSSIQVIQDVLRMRKFVITWPHMKYESEKTNS